MKAIHIDWKGPFTLEQVALLTNDSCDYGLYQIYGVHPTYHRVELLYIGLADVQTFGVRVPQHEWWMRNIRDVSQTQIYVGRLLGTDTPDKAVWTREIELAESLLIYAHYPSYNKQKDGAPRQPEFPTLHVFNWGAHRDLLQEVSGARLDKMPDMMVYGKALD